METPQPTVWRRANLQPRDDILSRFFSSLELTLEAGKVKSYKVEGWKIVLRK